MTSIKDNSYLTNLLALSENDKQIKAVLKVLTGNQIKLFKNIANDVLNEIIPLNEHQYNVLIQYKNFIRKLGRDKVTPNQLSRNFLAVKELSKLVLKENEMGTETCSNNITRMGKNKTENTKNTNERYDGNRTDTFPRKEKYDHEKLWEEYITEEEEENSDTENESDFERR